MADTPLNAQVDAAIAKHASGIQVGRDRSKGGSVEFRLRDDLLPLFGNVFPRLDRIYAGFAQASHEVETARGAPVCVDGCGQCCHTIPISTLAEAEYAASVLLGSPDLGWALERVREWLVSKPAFSATRKRTATYGRTVTPELYHETLRQEMIEVVNTETCPFLREDMRCGVWAARPPVCRAYGTVHAPNPWCSRPLGLGEDENSRISWDAKVPFTPGQPSLRQHYDGYQDAINGTQWATEGFFPMLLYKRFRANDLAGLVDDGKVPVARMMVGAGGTHQTLWQDQLDAEWSAAADQAIKEEVPLVERDGRLIMRVEA